MIWIFNRKSGNWLKKKTPLNAFTLCMIGEKNAATGANISKGCQVAVTFGIENKYSGEWALQIFFNWVLN